MKSLNIAPTLILMTAGVMLGGCSLPSKSVYIPIGSVVEVAGSARVPVYITNKETNKKEKRTITVQPDGVWHVGRLAPADNKPLPKPKKGWGRRLKDLFTITRKGNREGPDA